MNKSITFLLSGSGGRPYGGFKIVYEYANRLSAKGWKVSVIHPSILWPPRLSLRKKTRSFVGWVIRLFMRSYRPDKWFKINPKVKIVWAPTLTSIFIPNADYVVACPVESAFYVSGYSPKKGKKIYFIQHFEDWVMPKEKVEFSWKLPLRKLVIAKWLLEIAHSYKQNAIYIPNGLDFSLFKKLKDINDRPFNSICFLYHQLAWKGTRYAIEAMDSLKKTYPDLIVTIFCALEISESLPNYFQIFIDPPQKILRDIYNSSTIFLSPSLAEGWPLPPAEAMLCGCVVIATDIGGHREYLEDGINGLFCTPGSTESIVEKVEYIFNNPEIAAKISKQAPESLKKFDWDSRVDLFEKALLSDD